MVWWCDHVIWFSPPSKKVFKSSRGMQTFVGMISGIVRPEHTTVLLYELGQNRFGCAHHLITFPLIEPIGMGRREPAVVIIEILVECADLNGESQI